MYNLTDFSKDELRLMADMIESRLRHEELVSKFNKESQEDEWGNKAILQKKLDATITMLKDMNVRVLTSLQIVKDRETVDAN